MAKESLQQLKKLEDLLHVGNAVIDLEKKYSLMLEDANSILLHTSASDLNQKLVIEFMEVIKLAIEISQFKIEYLELFLAYIKRGILNIESGKIDEIVTYLLNAFKASNIDEIIDEIQNISLVIDTLDAFDDSIKGLSVDINICNSAVKRCIRDIYFEISKNYMNSILQRKISLNSKRLAILNWKKQIDSISSEFSPYPLTIEENASFLFGRECDVRKRSCHFVEK